MKAARIGTNRGQAAPRGDRVVTKPEGDAGSETARDIAAERASMAESIAAHRRRVSLRWGTAPAPGQSASRDHAREMLKASKAKVKALLGQHAVTESIPGNLSPTGELSLEDCHTLELLLSHVRHSVVRVCFYNLKLFCPSLVDEYDDEVRDQVASNLVQLPRAKEQLEAFFGQSLAAGRISALFPAPYRDCQTAFSELARLGEQVAGHLDQDDVRRGFAERAPGLIDAVMAPLGAMQEALDARKIAPADLVRQAVELSAAELERAGIAVEADIQSVPRIFAEETALLNCLCEVLTNAAKHSEARKVAVALREVHEAGYWVEIGARDDGKGMTAKELAACRERGVSNGGTGEGLPMIARIVEQEHLGRLNIDAGPEKGTYVSMRLPVKLEMNMLRALGES